MRVLAIDPGQKSGVCLYDTDTKFLVLQIIPGGLVGLQNYWNWHTELELAIRAGELTLVVESFELEEGTNGVDLAPVGIIGWFESLGVPIEWQRRNQRGKSKLISTAVLKRAGLYPKRGELKEGHQVAALQHALAYLVKIRHMPTVELLHPREETP
jgi:hypothetical protein